MSLRPPPGWIMAAMNLDVHNVGEVTQLFKIVKPHMSISWLAISLVTWACQENVLNEQGPPQREAVLQVVAEVLVVEGGGLELVALLAVVVGPGLALALGVDEERVAGGLGGDGEVVVVGSPPPGRSLHLSSVYGGGRR